jgi:hypothetical protein
MATLVFCCEDELMTAPFRDVRVLALWRDDTLQAPLTVDVRVDASATIASIWDVFGAFDLDGSDCRPFVLRRDGVIDFGANARDLAWSTDLRDKTMKVGVRFIVRWNEEDQGEYEIVKIAELGAKDARR